MKQNDIAEAIAFYNRKTETLVRHIIPVLDCLSSSWMLK